MNYFKNKNNEVYAYDDEQLAQAARLSELERIIKESESVYLSALNDLNQATQELNKAKKSYDIEASKAIDENNIEALGSHSIRLNKLEVVMNEKIQAYEKADSVFIAVESEYLTLKEEYLTILPVVYEVRDNINNMKKMSTKEVNAHINPPITKTQLIAVAEQQKQMLADEAEKNITILERKIRLNMATDDDKNSLTAWEIYSIKVSDIDTSTAPDIEWPVKP